nr:hypothetical protein [Tanacetum cinerariifolium]
MVVVWRGVVSVWRCGEGSGGDVDVAVKVAHGESGMGDRIDRETESLFGFVGKSPPEKFFGGGGVVPSGGGRLAGVAGGGGVGEKCVFNFFVK